MGSTLVHGTVGGPIAGGLFILPGIICIMALSYVYALWGNLPAVTALLFGLKLAVLAILVEAVIRIDKRSLKSPTLNALAVAAFIGIFFFAVPFPAIILTAGLLGLMGLVRASPISRGASTTNSVSDEQILFGDEPAQSFVPGPRRTPNSW
jgi:chromate transporter